MHPMRRDLPTLYGRMVRPKMKPMFALSLSFEGIQLLHRGAGGWRLVGGLGLDTPDLSSDLAALRKTASLIEPGGVRCKIIVPNDQLKYLSVSHDAANTKDVHAAARGALKDATPYEVKDLAFDVSQDGDVLHIAAVAYETLAEAEAFAVEHEFHPLCFTAIPGDAGFLGAPDFGLTEHARTLLEPGEVLEPDGIAVVVVGAVEIPAGPVVDVDTATPVIAPSDAKEEWSKPEPQELSDGTETDETPKLEAPEPETGPPFEHYPIAAAPVTEQAFQDPPAVPAFASIRAARQEPAQIDPAAPTLSGVTRDGGKVSAPNIPMPGASAAPDPAPSLLNGEAKIAGKTETGPDKDLAPTMAERPALDMDGAPGAHASLPPEKLADFLKRRTPDRLPPAPPLETDEAESLTVLGTPTSDHTRGKPRILGFILTGLLLLALAGVATWASIFLDNGVAELLGDGPDDPVIAAQPDVALPEDTPLQDEPDIASLDTSDTDLSDTDAAVLDALREAVPPEALTTESTEARYAVSGIWQTAPQVPVAPGLIDLDDLYIASIDAVAVTHDAIALPSVTTLLTDTGPAPVSSPAALGTLFALDDAGLVIPNTTGALAPSGITVYSGRPAVIPPSVPARQRPQTETENLYQTRLSKLRPRLRPVDLVEQNERSRLGGLTRNELAGVRPRMRPKVAKVEEERDLTPTAQAVTTSRKPKARPKDLVRIVKRTKKTSPEAAKVASAVTVAPASVAPKIPTSASVSKQATVRNAINLNRVNLIGVYGKPSSRRALVRLSSGRYQKVKVGDRIDGGRISAIGDAELSYVKGGRSVVLKMPKG